METWFVRDDDTMKIKREAEIKMSRKRLNKKTNSMRVITEDALIDDRFPYLFSLRLSSLFHQPCSPPSFTSLLHNPNLTQDVLFCSLLGCPFGMCVRGIIHRPPCLLTNWALSSLWPSGTRT